MIEKPSWYVTPQEFADLVVETMEKTGYFKADEFSHPEDLVLSFITTAEAIAAGMSYAGRRVWQKEKSKKAVMESSNLKKDQSSVNMDLYWNNS